MTRTAVALLLSVVAAVARGEAPVLAPGYGALQYTPPAPGSYALPPLGVAVDGSVLDASGRAMRLYDVLDAKFVLMGFIYTHCPDVNGCPLASYVMKQVQRKLAEEPELDERVRLVSLSFDPVLDTPDVMREYSRHFRDPDSDWVFLTTASEADLEPILDGYGQFRARFYNPDGSYSGSMSHVLRVYLIDRQHRIRNIYSAGFLHPDTTINDIKTLVMEQQSQTGVGRIGADIDTVR